MEDLKSLGKTDLSCKSLEKESLFTYGFILELLKRVKSEDRELVDSSTAQISRASKNDVVAFVTREFDGVCPIIVIDEYMISANLVEKNVSRHSRDSNEKPWCFVVTDLPRVNLSTIELSPTPETNC